MRQGPAQRLLSSDTTGDARRGFDATRVWVFDLDNTLYPSACNLFAEVDHRMGAFIAQHLDLPLEHARYLQKRYYHDYGTTLTGLIQLHKVDPHAFLEFVHDIDLVAVERGTGAGATLWRRCPGAASSSPTARAVMPSVSPRSSASCI